MTVPGLGPVFAPSLRTGPVTPDASRGGNADKMERYTAEDVRRVRLQRNDREDTVRTCMRPQLADQRPSGQSRVRNHRAKSTT